MLTMKKSIASISNDSMEYSSSSSPYCSLSKIRRSQSVSEVHEDILNITPRPSQHYPIFHVGGRMQVQNSSSSNSSNNMTSTEVSMPKSATELIEEITTLEVEVVHLERYLLSLYRTAFDQCIANSSHTTEASKSPSEWQSCNEIMIEDRHSSNSISYYDINNNMDRCRNTKRTDVRRKINFENVEDTSSRLSTTAKPKKDVHKSMPYHNKSLADHLGASIFDHVPQTASKLSEDIIKCISAIYCKLSVSQTRQTDILPSSPPSSSPSSTLSAHDACDSWSPRCHYEGATTSPCSYYSFKNNKSSYSDMVEIPRISVDGDKFDYASKMLSIFRSLIRKLEKVNPDNMNHEEKLAFWINIHNALVMHAFLAYGLQQNHMKSSYSIMKAAYNVSGHTVNAHVIQSSILGCHLNRHALGILTLFSPSKSLKKVKDKHPFALKLSEPFAHFALSLGGYSDPAVRVYTAKNIYQELKTAKDEFIQSTVRIEKRNKIIIPKVLYYYAKDASLELTSLTKMVSESMPEIVQKNIEGCLHHRKIEKCIEWSPYKSSFRYLVHRDLVKN